MRGASFFRNIILSVAVCALVAHSSAFACSIVWMEYFVKPNFTVTIVDRTGKPKPNARVFVRGHEAHSETTDGMGVAKFVNLSPGSYRIVVEGEFGKTEGESLVVNPTSAAARDCFSMAWPQEHVLVTRSLVGRIEHSGKPLANKRLVLFERATEKPLDEQITDGEGRFAFSQDRPSDYFFNIKAFGDSTDRIYVRLDHDAAIPDLQLELTLTSCGVFYDDARACPQANLRTSARAGQIVDDMGAVIPRTEVLIFASNAIEHPQERALGRFQSDSRGRFALEMDLGEYLVYVLSPGFQPLLSRVSLNEQSDSGFLVATLRIAGSGRCGELAIRDKIPVD